MSVLKQLKELQDTWRNQNFHYTKEQKELYQFLLEVRREQVKYFYETGRVSKGRSSSSTES